MSAPLHILIVDDDETDRMFLKRHFRKLSKSITVHEASQVAEGLKIVQSVPIDCVLLDYRLPGRDGIEFISECEAVAVPKVPAIIMMTGKGNEKIAVAAMKAGAEDYLVKDEHDPAELLTVIEKAIDTVRRSEHEAESQAQMKAMALTDPVAQIGSRHLFEMRLAHAIDRVRREKSSIALLVMDLNKFKEVNDTLGHQFGDDVLREIGQRMQSVIRGSDTLARLGGDEYVVIMETGVTREGAHNLADRIRQQVIEPIRIDDQCAAVGISIGIALYPQDGADAEKLVEAADAAMYADKKRLHAAARAAKTPGPAAAESPDRVTN